MADLTWPTVPISNDDNSAQPVPAPDNQPAQDQSHNTDSLPSQPPDSNKTARFPLRTGRDMNHSNLDRHPSPQPRPSPRNPHDPDDSVHFVHCTLREGDTRVFIDAPKIHTDPRHRTSCDGIVPASQSFLVHSEKLLALGDSKFAQMLNNEIYQARVRRRRKPTEGMMKGVRYLLDLTPPSEGDDLVFQMTELSVTSGIAKWWNADLVHIVPRSLVKGHDDICQCCHDTWTARVEEVQKQENGGKVSMGSAAEEPRTDQGEISGIAEASQAGVEARVTQEEMGKIMLPPSPIDLLRLQSDGQNELYQTPPHYQIPDYCPFRHRNSIVRLLMMIEGKRVNLNSAARVWTMVGISKIFECTSVVRIEVAQWIMSNTKFIEVLPEESLSIGFTLKLPQVTQSAFRILVNELALNEAGDKEACRDRQVTIFGRRLGDSGDERSNLIQHAARALNERVNSQISELLKPDLFDFRELKVWSKMREIEHLLTTEDDGTFGKALNMLRQLMAALVHKFTSRVESTVKDRDYCWNASIFQDMDRDRATYVAPQDYKSTQDIVLSLNEAQRLLLPFFYSEFGRQLEYDLFRGQLSEHPDTIYQFFTEMVRILEAQIQNLVDSDPRRAYQDSWQVLFQPPYPDWLGDSRPEVLSSHGRTPNQSISSPLIDLDGLEHEIKQLWRPIAKSGGRNGGNGFVPQLNITRHLLLTLTDNEMKFLPLWAGGNDDGTGGVFETFLPPAEMGPAGPGPAYHTGLTVPSAPSSEFGWLMEEITAMKVRGSTTAGSVDVHDSVSTVYPSDRIIAAESSIGSESFAEDNSDYDRAKFEVPAEHQATGQSVNMLVDSPAEESDDALSDVTEIGPYISDDDVSSDQGMQDDDDDKRSNSNSADSMVIV
ncbi:hypothetical protein ACO1O0_004188 [Amphichorda felina]